MCCKVYSLFLTESHFDQLFATVIYPFPKVEAESTLQRDETHPTIARGIIVPSGHLDNRSPIDPTVY
jgi:hypothetical protein